MGRVEEWYVDPIQWRARRVRTVIEVQQPFANHDGGQIVFGPDGRLYIGFGDGGWRNDPNGHGQNGRTWLGSMLRIDVDGGRDAAYTVPVSNPWVGDDSVADEAWAIGLRNPWRFSFAPDGRMVVADVGQNAFEEIDLVVAGDNLGWNTREGRHCLDPETPCAKEGLVEPVYEYGRDEGKSITGGFVYTGNRVPALKDQYVFADFVSGRLWAISLPAERGGALVAAAALGQWPFLPSTFGRAADGEIYVAGFGKGIVYRIDPS
jgi:glucose/arabinose dehydrogenase